jgi:hypothetical protein
MSKKVCFLISFVLVLTLASISYGVPGTIKLDLNNTTDNNDANTAVGFTKFSIQDSGTEVNGITIDLIGDLHSARRLEPNNNAGYGPVWGGQNLYRDFVHGVSPSGVTVTLWGLGVNQQCDITIYPFDAKSEPNRVADWYGNEVYLFTTNFKGEDPTLWPCVYNFPTGDPYKKTATATADALGRIVLASTRNPASPEDKDFAFVNALIVVPKGTYVPTVYSQHPVPFNSAEDVQANVILEWKESVYAEKHDVYFGTNEANVTDANRSNPLGVLVDPNHLTTNYDPSPAGILDFDTTYYWRIDEVNDPNIWKGEVWSFTTYVPVPIASNPVPLDGAEGVLADVTLSWEKGEYAEKHDVYFGTDEAKVTDANRSNPLGVLVDPNHLTTTYDPPGMLDLDTIYYWRIDEVNSAPDYTIFKGDVWSFTTYVPALTDMPTWIAGSRCFLDGPPGAFDDIAVKDPSIVYYGGKWHLFYTGRDSNYWRMGYASANSISELNSATRHYLSSLNGGTYFCAPQVFWFEAKGEWYLIYQSGLGPTFSTNTDINDPNGWAAGQYMGFTGGVVDYWCISDGNNVYIFYSPMDGSRKILRRNTTVEDFPYGWSSVTVAATDTFEAVHVYKNKADGKYYMMVEDMGATRWQELWTARSPGGMWTKIAEYWATKSNLIETEEHWTDQVSHGEILRSGTNERMEIDNIDRCEVLIQGVVDGDYGAYGNTPYNLGLIREYPAGLGDLDTDLDVDFVDFAVLASQWLQPPGAPSADIEPPGGDGIVNMNDLGLFVNVWLWEK